MKIIKKPLTLSIALVEQEPSTFLATQVYLAASLNLTDFIIRIAVPVLSSYVTCISSDTVISFPSLYHFTLGVGLPIKIV